ncbi:MAG: hypothetical protein JWP11_3155 [Frankiales bacterium]|jgi:hypothetical protein|nr:hypothetical protein [Frankiales bacterium]
MSAVSIRMSDDATTVLCEHCGGSESLPRDDKGALVQEVRGFLQAHGVCQDRGELSAGRMP